MVTNLATASFFELNNCPPIFAIISSRTPPTQADANESSPTRSSQTGDDEHWCYSSRCSRLAQTAGCGGSAVACAMLSIEHLLIITSADGKARWNVSNDMLVTLDDKKYVKLHMSAHGLNKLVMQSCDYPDGTNLTTSIGYQCLVKQRNDLHEAKQLAAREEAVPGLFKGLAQNVPKMKPKTRAEITAARNNPLVMELKVPAFAAHEERSISVLSPVSPRDDLCVPLEADVLHHLVSYFADAGFDSTLASPKKRAALPSGAPLAFGSARIRLAVSMSSKCAVARARKRTKEQRATRKRFSLSKVHVNVITKPT